MWAAGLLGIASFLAGSGWLLLGNKYRFAEFQVMTDGDAFSVRDPHGDPQPDADPRRLGSRQDPKLCGRWNPLTKRALLSLPSLDNRLDAHAADTGYESLGFKWKTGDRLAFKGRKKPSPLGRLTDELKITTVLTSDRLNPGSSRAWERCWTLERPLVPQHRPPGLPDGPSYSTLAIFMRLRNPGFLKLYWTHLIFVVALAGAILAVRLIHITFF
jgi:hypothetical protein